MATASNVSQAPPDAGQVPRPRTPRRRCGPKRRGRWTRRRSPATTATPGYLQIMPSGGGSRAYSLTDLLAQAKQGNSRPRNGRMLGPKMLWASRKTPRPSIVPQELAISRPCRAQAGVGRAEEALPGAVQSCRPIADSAVVRLPRARAATCVPNQAAKPCDRPARAGTTTACSPDAPRQQEAKGWWGD